MVKLILKNSIASEESNVVSIIIEEQIEKQWIIYRKLSMLFGNKKYYHKNSLWRYYT